MNRRTHLSLRLLLLFALAGALPVRAQTATVTGLTGQACAGTRTGTTLGCTANDFTTTATFTQPASSQVASCVAGSTLTLNLIAHITGSKSTRYNAAIFFGEGGNDPVLNDASKTCGLAVFPLTPAPFEDYDTNVCGDFLAGGNTADLQVNGLQVKCRSDATSGGHLVVPFTVVWSNNTGACTAQTVTAATGSKCSSNSSQQVTLLDGTPVGVFGFINLTVQTVPAASPQSFAFSTTGSSTTPAPASFSLTAGQTQQVLIPLAGTTTLELDEALVPGWSSTASITCTDPSGAPASFVTVDNANRRLVASLDFTNYGANCTLTNSRAAGITLRAQSEGGTAAFSFSGGTNGLPSSLTLDTSVANPAVSAPYSVTTNGVDAQITQAIPAGWRLSASCTDGASTFGSLSGGTLTLPAAKVVTDAAIVCTFVSTRNASLAKAFLPASVGPGSASTLTFTVTNPGGNPAQPSFGFTDVFPANLSVASPMSASSSCGGTLYRGGTVIPLAAGDTSVTLAGGALPAGAGGCTVSVQVQSAVQGSYTNGPANVAVTGALINAVTPQTLSVSSVPLLKLSKTANPVTAPPGGVVTYTLSATNTGTASATSVVLSDHLGPFSQLSLNAFGAGVLFQFSDGTPSSGLTLGTPVYSNDGGATFVYTPISGGGGAPPGFDGNVTDWRIPMSGSMAAGGSCSVQFKAAVK